VLDVGGYPNGIAFDRRGSMWVADPEAAEVSRLDPATGEVQRRILAGRSPFLLEEGFGSIWCSNHLDGQVLQIDPRTGTVADTIEIGSTSASLVVRGDDLWASAGDGDVVLIDVATNEVTRRIHFGGDMQGMEVAFGFLFVTVFEESNVKMFELSTGQAMPPIPLGDGAAGIASAGGRVWAAASTDTTIHAIWPPGRVGELDLGTGVAPFAMEGFDGRLFVGDKFESRIIEVDARKRVVAAVHDIPSPVIAIAQEADGTTWATSGDAGAVVRLASAA
jgi:DNA-binding beta-propeller fold protein YncE